MRIRSFIARHRLLTGSAGALITGLIVFVLLWFQPQKLFIEKTVNEAEPMATVSATQSPPVELASGSFRSLEHRTTGRARLLRLGGGEVVLRFEGLDTSNGPDLRVYLSELTADRGWHAYGVGFLELGALKGNRGSQNYRVPAGTDLARYRSAVIWCRRFAVGFGVAPLNG
jgi:hypothetical protein